MKIFAVCGFGVGSSLILKMTLDRVFQKLGIEAEVENADMNSVIGTQCDAVFTSHQLFESIDNAMPVTVYAIAKYTSTEEVEENVRDLLEKMDIEIKEE